MPSRDGVAMENEDQQWQTWVRKLAAGDSAIVSEFWAEYGGRLERLAANHLTVRLHRRVGPEDISQSACRTFLRRVQDGQFEFVDSESLWRLMCAITMTKVREHARYHLRQKRGVQRERQLDSGKDGSQTPAVQLSAAGPTPEEALEFADELEKLLSSMDDEERQLVQLKLEQQTNLEIAKQMGCSERTVRRILKRVQSRMAQMLEETR